MLASWTLNQIVNQLDTGYHWLAPAILYKFPSSATEIFAPNGEADTFQALNPTQKDFARLAFATWNDLIAKPIAEVSQWSQIGLANSTTETEFAHAYFPTRSSIWFNTDAEVLQRPVIGDYGFETFIHEIGHALGLDHMGAYNGEGEWSASCFQDSSVYSVMSYFGPEHNAGENLVAWADWSVDGVTYSPQTPMLHDVYAIQSIYGASTKTRTADTTYGFNTNITGSLASLYDFSLNTHPILTLYDSSGIDLLDLSGWSSVSDINLNPGSYSSCNEMTNNLCVAFGCDIENLTTGGGNDRLQGNALNNRLLAGAGNDLLSGGLGNNFIDGGIGTDTATYGLNVSNYRIYFDGTSLRVDANESSPSTQDTLSQIETLQFENTLFTTSFSSETTADPVARFNGLYTNTQVEVYNDNFTVTNNGTGEHTITVYQDINRIEFSDLTAAADLGEGESTGIVYRLYLTVLGRNPENDPTGCGFWVNRLDEQRINTEQLVQWFLNSEEFVTRFGASTSSNQSFVNQLYLNLLKRDGHTDSGFTFWQSVLDSNSANRAQVVVGFMESPENLGNAAELIGTHATFKTWVGDA